MDNPDQPDSDDHARELHPLLHGRFSPLTFDPDVVMNAEDVHRLLEAARWAPSAGNSQPWGFVTALRGSPEHVVVTRRLAASSARWAPTASLLIVNVAHSTIESSDIEYSEFSDYDLGQAVAHVTLQAQALGWACRQFRGFDLRGLSDDLSIAPGWRIRSMTAVGRGTGEVPPRVRRPLADLRPPLVSCHPEPVSRRTVRSRTHHDSEPRFSTPRSRALAEADPAQCLGVIAVESSLNDPESA